MGARLALAVTMALAAQVAGAAALKPPARLFADDQPVRVTLRGPISAILATRAPARTARPAVLALTAPAAEQHTILLSPRGLTRRQKQACTFPPLRVEFTASPKAPSLFERQKRLKLVTHCRASPAHQNYVLLEYAAYRMLNLLSPAALRVRLGTFDYVEQSGRPLASRLGFFLEDPDDAARRAGLKEIRSMAGISPSQLDPAAAARAALFEYMIGNTDWSMRAGPAGDICCHNFRLFGATAQARGGLVPIPYDFDASGLVDAPYAAPSEVLGLGSVRERRYRGYCIHNAQALAAAAEFRSRRGELLAVLAAVPGLDERRRRGPEAYLEAFFRDIATDDDVRKRLLRTCIN
jgi:hypothetical protein